VSIEIVIVLVLIVFNGLLSMSEMAIVSSRNARLKAMAERGERGADKAIDLASAPGRFLSTVQIGITLIGVLAGAFSGATLSDKLAIVLRDSGLSREIADQVAFGIVVAVITYLSLIIGELVPKQIALRAPERVAAVIAGPMSVLSRIATPVVFLLDVSSAAVLRLFGSDTGDGRRVTDEEIRTLIAEAEASGVVDAGERRMISGVMRLADRGVRAIMTPLPDVEWVDLLHDDAAVLQAIRGTRRSRLLACDGQSDNVIGVLHVRDVLQDRLDGRSTAIRDLVKSPIMLPDTLGALQALERLHESGGDGFGLVVDEYGHSEGIVTSADALAAIRGSAVDMAGGEDAMVVTRPDGTYLVSGALPVDGLEELLRQTMPGDRQYHTVAGLLLYQMRRVPAAGEYLDLAGWRFEVVDMDGRRIDKVLVSRLR
jgi:putative hemolysin